MRVTHTTIEGFRGDIADCSTVMDKIVRCRVDRTPQQDEAVSFDVLMWLTAIVQFTADGEHALVEAPILFPEDDEEGNVGSEMSTKAVAEMDEFCRRHGLSLRTGKIEFV